MTDGSVAYTCAERSCKARVFVCGGECFFSTPFYGHQHGNKHKEIDEMKILNSIKQKIVENSTTSQTTSQISEVREIFDEVVVE